MEGVRQPIPAEFDHTHGLIGQHISFIPRSAKLRGRPGLFTRLETLSSKLAPPHPVVRIAYGPLMLSFSVEGVSIG